MVNQQTRTQAAALIRAFLAGEIDNNSFVDDFPCDERDHALKAIERRLWFYYNDVRQRHCEFALGSPEEMLFRRCALFLDAGLEYEWPELRGHNLSHPIVAIITGEIFQYRRVETAKAAGEYVVWPFFRSSDFYDAKRRHGQDDVATDDAVIGMSPLVVAGSFAVGYMMLQTLLFFAGIAALIACFFVRSEELLLSAIICIVLYVALLFMGRFVRPHAPKSTASNS